MFVNSEKLTVSWLLWNGFDSWSSKNVPSRRESGCDHLSDHLLKKLLDTVVERSAALKEFTAVLQQQQPPPLADQTNRLDKVQALADHVSRFSSKLM